MSNDDAAQSALNALNAHGSLHALRAVRRPEHRAVLHDARVEVCFDPERREYVLGRTRAS
jgi:hypothetical protein